jgi:hypothetical protein
MTRRGPRRVCRTAMSPHWQEVMRLTLAALAEERTQHLVAIYAHFMDLQRRRRDDRAAVGLGQVER